MTIKVAINGYGRIGRNILRALYETENPDLKNIQIVAINDLSPPQSLLHLTKYDSTHGKFNQDITLQENCFIINNNHDNPIQLLSIRDPQQLPWAKLNIDLVFECTGLFANKDKAAWHLDAGAKKVLVSSPSGPEVKTIVYGINHHILDEKDLIVSNASCTTNCLAPLILPLHKTLKVQSGLMTTIHAYTNDQTLTDMFHPDLRRARSATASMIPTKTGAASTIGLIIPELNGKLDGLAIRVPTANVSLVDLSVLVEKNTSAKEVNNILLQASSKRLLNITSINELPLVSVDFNHHSASSIFDLTQTKVIGKLVKVLAWYDNEWGFANRMLDTAYAMYAHLYSKREIPREYYAQYKKS
jgi:glyceraldehyde 3-phosphate dehydrogenase